MSQTLGFNDPARLWSSRPKPGTFCALTKLRESPNVLRTEPKSAEVSYRAAMGVPYFLIFQDLSTSWNSHRDVGTTAIVRGARRTGRIDRVVPTDRWRDQPGSRGSPLSTPSFQRPIRAASSSRWCPWSVMAIEKRAALTRQQSSQGGSLALADLRVDQVTLLPTTSPGRKSVSSLPGPTKTTRPGWAVQSVLPPRLLRPVGPRFPPASARKKAGENHTSSPSSSAISATAVIGPRSLLRSARRWRAGHSRRSPCSRRRSMRPPPRHVECRPARRDDIAAGRGTWFPVS